jgi:hypothetical protein
LFIYFIYVYNHQKVPPVNQPNNQTTARNVGMDAARGHQHSRMAGHEEGWDGVGSTETPTNSRMAGQEEGWDGVGSTGDTVNLQDDRRWQTMNLPWKLVKRMAMTHHTVNPLIP